MFRHGERAISVAIGKNKWYITTWVQVKRSNIAKIIKAMPATSILTEAIEINLQYNQDTDPKDSRKFRDATDTNKINYCVSKTFSDIYQ